MSNPKLFVSYSWTTPDHESWVLTFASDLVAAGVDVILDKWDLKEGQDANVFMESMVNDENIKKVALICDAAYAAKADGRKGGVGTESQIISPEIYAKHDQNKFVAILVERDAEGNACLPTYCKTRKYIDFADPGRSEESMKQTIAWIYDEPLYKKPTLGAKPDFLKDKAEPVALVTTSYLRRAIDALRNSRPFADIAVEEYFSQLSVALGNSRAIPKSNVQFDDIIMQNIDEFLPYRDEAIELFIAMAKYKDDDGSRRNLHRFIESVLPYFNRPDGVDEWTNWSADNFKFLIHELFLYMISILLMNERFESVNYLLETEYYWAKGIDRVSTVDSFERLFYSLPSFEGRNARLELRRLSLRADSLKRRCKIVGIEFRHLMQADLVLYLRSAVSRGEQWEWWPETLVYAAHFPRAFELFVRCRSRRFFDHAKMALGVGSKEELAVVIVESLSGRMVPQWDFDRVNAVALTGLEDIATRP